MKRTLSTRMTVATAAAALALGAAACEVEDGGTGDETMEEPLLDDGSGDGL